MASLAVRIAQSKMVSRRRGKPVKVMLYDESLGHLHQDTQKAVLEAVKRMAGEMFRQLLVVTHAPAVEQVADQMIEVTMDSQGAASAQRTDGGGGHPVLAGSVDGGEHVE